MKAGYRTLLLLILFQCTQLVTPFIYSQVLDENLWVPDGPVNSIVRRDNTIYIGGNFSKLAPVTGCGVAIETTSVMVDPSYLKIHGVVSAVIADGVGGWYVGGSFTSVGGILRNNLV